MSAAVLKFRNFFSDLRLEAELQLKRFFHRRKKNTPPLEYKIVGSAVPTVKPAAMPEAVLKPADKETLKKEKLPFAIRMLRLTSKDRLFFFDQMSTLISSGVTLMDSLSLVRAQTRNNGMKKLYGEMIHRINAGMGLAETMTVFSHIFPSMQVALIEAAEKSGNLKLVLEDIVSDMDNHQDFLRKVKGAMFYPVLLIGMALILVAGMMVFVIPRISGMYDQANVKLPALTQAVIRLSDFMRDYWPVLLGGVAGGLLFLWLLFSKTRFGRLFWEKLVRLVPIFGKISKEKSLMIIAANMAMLLKSGVLIAEAFEITEKTVGNLHYERALRHIRHDVVMGKTMSEAMGLTDINNKKFRENKLFPLQFAQLVHIGETTGTIGEMLVKARTNYHKSIDYKLKNMSALIEPLMIFIVALLVGSILLAVMLPFFYIGTTIH